MPAPGDSNGLLIVKLKRKLEFKVHVVFEAVKPASVLQFLEFLKSHNPLFSVIGISQNDKLEENEIYSQLLRCLDEPAEVNIELSIEEEIEKEDPLSEFRGPSVETTNRYQETDTDTISM